MKNDQLIKTINCIRGDLPSDTVIESRINYPVQSLKIQFVDAVLGEGYLDDDSSLYFKLCGIAGRNRMDEWLMDFDTFKDLYNFLWILTGSVGDASFNREFCRVVFE